MEALYRELLAPFNWVVSPFANSASILSLLKVAPEVLITVGR